MKGIKLEFNAFNRIWEQYKHVWEVDREDTIVTFVKRKPILKDFEDELQKYNMARSQLTTEKVEYVYGSILISCGTLRDTIDTEIKQDRRGSDFYDYSVKSANYNLMIKSKILILIQHRTQADKQTNRRH